MNLNHEIKKLYESGFSIKKISNILNIDNKYIKKYIEDNELIIIKEKFDNNKIDYIIDLYSKGVSAKTLGYKYSIDKRRVQKWAKEKNILRSKNNSHRFTFFNEHIFDTINSESKAYWLGFFYADAYNNEKSKSVSICLAKKDKDHIIKLSSFLDFPKYKITDGYTMLNNKKYFTTTIKLYSKHLCNMLHEQGCPQAKSFIIKYPKFLSSNLDVYFIRGLFDGDGSLCKTKCNNEWKFKLVSTHECLNKIQKIIYENTNILAKYSCISKTGNNTYEMVVSGNEQVLCIMNWLYNKNIDIVLKRKYDKYIELISQQKNRNLNRDNYLLSEQTKQLIYDDIKNGVKNIDIAKKYKIHRITVNRLKNK